MDLWNIVVFAMQTHQLDQREVKRRETSLYQLTLFLVSMIFGPVFFGFDPKHF